MAIFLRLSVCGFIFLSPLLGCSGGPSSGDAVDGPGAEVRALTGARTRVVWVQADENDPRATGDRLVLMGLDTHDGKGERTILGDRRSYVKPLLTPSGQRIIFSSRAIPGPPEVFVVNWDGTELRKLADGFALDVWKHPKDGTEWVYAGTDNKDYDFAAVWRFPIDAPEKRELVWDKSVVGMDGFKVSADGRHASGLCPWPDAMIADLQNGTLKKLGEGCWTSLTTARGPLFWYFDGAHRNVTMVDVDTGARWMVNLNHAEGFDGAEVYHPRWTNHPRFLTLSGPYNQGGPNQARTGGKQVEVYLGRFSPDFSKVEAWARVTNNSGGDTYPDVWIDAASSPHSTRPRGPVGPPNATAARSTAASASAEAGRLVINVRLDRATVIPEPRSILPYRNAMVVNEYDVLDVIQGTYTDKAIRIAQWAIRDSRVIESARRIPGAAFTLVVEKFDAHPELEGERLISESENSTLPLYYDRGN